MDERTAAIEDFFASYAGEFAQALEGHADAEATARHFTDCFIEASVHGVSCGRNDEVFRQQIPRGYDFYRSIGMKSMLVRDIQVSPLDGAHSIARVRWDSTYGKPDGTEESIDFEVIYFLQMTSGEPKIFGYITGDEQAIMRERGLI